MSTRKAPYKHADGSNCWTKDCRLGHVRNAAAEGESFEAWIPKNMPKVWSPYATVQRLQGELVRPENSDLDYDSIKHDLEWIEEWDKPWTEADEKNLKAAEKIAVLVQNNPFTAKHRAKVQAIIDAMEPVVEHQKPQQNYLRGYGATKDDSWRARDKMLHSLANDLLVRRLADDIEEPQIAEVDNDRLLGLRAAQEAALENLNHADWYKRNGTSYMGAVEPHFQNAIARAASGEELSDLDDGESNRDLFPPHQRIFSALHPSGRNSSATQLYLASVFPVNELKAEMERAGIDGVSVSPFLNGREWGNAYTVVTPDGGTRTFSVYEHRNTDSIIINGTENWDGESLPYSGGTKHDFFAEFEPEDRKRAAQALTFYLTQAQSGALESPEELANKVSRRDWNAILDASIPGFKQWRQESIGDHYIAPEQENDEDVLKRLDF